MLAGGDGRHVKDPANGWAAASDVTLTSILTAFTGERSNASQSRCLPGADLAKFGHEGEQGEDGHPTDAVDLFQAFGFSGEDGIGLDLRVDQSVDELDSLFEAAHLDWKSTA